MSTPLSIATVADLYDETLRNMMLDEMQLTIRPAYFTGDMGPEIDVARQALRRQYDRENARMDLQMRILGIALAACLIALIITL